MLPPIQMSLKQMSTPHGTSPPRKKGFTRTSALLRGRIRDASASRGFAQSRLLTHWEEIAGPEMAGLARPVEVTYARGGFGATLVLLTTGANAPVLDMVKDKLRDRVNAVYGYNAISRIRITQTAPTGFADGQVAFRPKAEPEPELSEAARAEAAGHAAKVTDPDLRAALERLGANILSKSNS
jgi:hypothetical protein